MERALQIIRLTTLAIVVMALGALSGWFIYLHAKQGNITATDALRGENTDSHVSGNIPFGSVLDTSSSSYSPGTSTSTHTAQRIWHIDENMVAGMGFSSSSLMYVIRATGYIMQADLIAQNTQRISDTLTPKIYEAYIATDGSIAERSIDTQGVTTLFLGAIATTTPNLADATTSVQSIFSGTYTTPGIAQFALNATTKQFIYTEPTSSGGDAIFLRSWDGKKDAALVTMPLSDWLPFITADGRMFLTQSPADDMEGYTYTISTKGTPTPIIRNVPGLTFLPQPNGKAYLYGSSQAGTLNITLVASSTGMVIPLPTIADKCVWAPQGIVVYCAVPKSITTTTFLNDWYRGIAHTQDEWWRIDMSTSTRIYDPAGDNLSFDVESPIIDPTGTYLVFKNRDDGSLWALNVNQ